MFNQNFTQMTDEEILTFVDDLMSNPAAVEIETHPLETAPKELIYRIILLAGKDPVFFISLLRTSASDGFIPLKLYEKQEEILDTIGTDHYLLLLGSRQTGKTTVIQSYMLWLLMFIDNYRVGILMQKEKSSKDFINELMNLYYSLPNWLQSELVVDNAIMKVFGNNSKLEGFAVDPKNPDAVGRGLRVDFLVIDEAAFIYKIDKAYTALKPATSRRHLRLKKAGKPYGTVIISTPNGTTGIGEWFYTQWQRGVSSKSMFKAIKFHWMEVPEYTAEWFKNETSDMSQRDINQEYELKFLGSNHAWLEDDVIEKVQDISHIRKPITTTKLAVGSIELFDEIKNDTVYVIGADSADSGADYAAMTIMNYLTEEIIGCYYNDNVAITEFELDVAMILKLIPNSVLVFEKNSIGSSTAQRLYHEFGASRIYVHKADKRFTKDAYKYAGFATTSVSRKLMFSSIYTYVKDNPDKIICQNLVYELISLEQKGTRVEAADNSHDDLVLTLGFILYFMNHDKADQYISQFNNIKDAGNVQQTEVLQMISEFNKDSVKRAKPQSTSSINADIFSNKSVSLGSIEQSISDRLVENIQDDKAKTEILTDLFGVF